MTGVKNNRFEFDARVRYSEIDHRGTMTLPALINYFQDCSTFHSETVGVGMDFLADKQKVWVLSAWQIVVERYPMLCEKIKVSTWPYEFRHFMGKRNFTMEDEEGNRVAYANTLWTYLDLKTGHPAMVDEKQVQAYELEEKLDMSYAPRKISVSGEFQEFPSFQVKAHHLDTNHHVNNGQYILMAMEYLPKDFTVREMRAEYKNQAVLDNVIVPKVHEENGIYTVMLENSLGVPFAVVELK